MRKKTKGIVAFGLSASMVLALIPHMNTYADTETLDVVKQSEFADKNLYAFVKQAGDTNGDGILTREEAENITSLDFSMQEITIDDYTGLTILKNLTSAFLYINDDKSVGNFIDNVYDKSKITYFSVNGQSISEEQFNRIAELENLTSLAVGLEDGSVICNPDLKFNDKIKYLNVTCYGYGDFSMNYLKYFSAIEDFTLYFYSDGYLKDTNKLNDYRLNSLSISAYGLVCDNIAVPDCTKSLNLDFGRDVTPTVEVDLNNSNLEELWLMGCKNVDISKVEKMSSLQGLCLSNCTIKDHKDSIDFAKNTELSTLSLYDLKIKNITGIKDNKNIHSISIQDTLIEDVSCIPQCVNYLSLNSNKITDIPDWSSADFNYFNIGNNNLTLDKVKGKIPEQYENDIEWVTENLYYKNDTYEQLPSEYLYSKIKSCYEMAGEDNPHVYLIYRVYADKITLNSDLVNYLSDKDIDVTFLFCNKYATFINEEKNDFIERCVFKSSHLNGYSGSITIDFSNWNIAEADEEIVDSYTGSSIPYVCKYNPHTENDTEYLEYSTEYCGWSGDIYEYYGNGLYENIGKNIDAGNFNYVIERNGNENAISYFMTDSYDDSNITDEKDKLSSPETHENAIEDIAGFIDDVEEGATVVIKRTYFNPDTWNKMIDKKLKCIFVSDVNVFGNMFTLTTDYENMEKTDSNDVDIYASNINNFSNDIFSKSVSLDCGYINNFKAKIYVGDIYKNGETLVDSYYSKGYITKDWQIGEAYSIDSSASRYVVESGYISLESSNSIWMNLTSLDDLVDFDTVDKAPVYRRNSEETYANGDTIYTKGGDRIKSIDLSGLQNGITIHCNTTINDLEDCEYLVAMDARGRYGDERELFGIEKVEDRFLIKMGQCGAFVNDKIEKGKTYDIYVVVEEDNKYTIFTIYINGKLVDKLRHYSAENGTFTQNFVAGATEFYEYSEGASFKEINKDDLTALYITTSHVLSSFYTGTDEEHINVLNSYEILAGRSVPKDFKDIEMGDATPGDATPGEPEKPTETPTEKPTETPIEKPTEAPTEAPTEKPTEAPTVKPVVKPTEFAKPEVVDKKEVVDHEKVVENIKDKLVTTKNTKKVDVVTNKAPVISADIFKLVDNNSKNLTVGVVDDNNQLQYSWTFAASEIKDTTKDVDLTITFDSDRQEKIEKLTGETDSLYINFAYHGNLPGTSTVKLYVGNKYGNNEKVYIYYYDEEEDKVLMVGRKPLTVKDGYVEFSITHCSTYFLSETKYNVEQDKSSLDDATVKVGTDSEDVPTGDNTSKICYMLAIIILCFVGIIVVADTKATKLSRQKE
ncbi:hypothetical protein [Eshraghiella crossota]|uniref:Leucine Rich Repeat protein n=1 Tax=Eshraghiella crossota DSM 2876 TaxID=511680 RepID=D4S1Z5_9FIRM|nr:hypothetical protein [Butyrivibrio crossotus]EFF67697.1 hypothetical protein BUTYVIB_02117 [Butyrivibrio crossotus DSM 2876]